MSSSLGDTAVKYTILGVFVIGVGYWLFKELGSGVAKVVTTDLNPLSDQNLAYSGANAAIQAVTGTDDSVGTELANIFAPSAQEDGFAPTVTLPQAANTSPPS